MANYFTILDLPVSLALDVEAIEGSWRERAKSSDDASLHEARATLTDPVNRLEHWLATHKVTPERGSSIDPNMMDLFSCLHGVLADTDRVIEGLRSSTTALTKALLSKDAIAAQLEIQGCMKTIREEKESRIARFPEFEKAASEDHFDAAVGTLGQLKFLRKWEQQCQERLLTLLEY